MAPFPATKKLRLFFLYIRYTATYALFRLLRKSKGSERLLGWTVHFQHYGSFYDQFREIFLLDHCRLASSVPDPRIVDGGGNIGMAIFYFLWIYPNANILSLEPDPQNLHLLEMNIRENKLENVKVVHAALSSEEGNLVIFEDKKDLWRTSLTIIRGVANQRGENGEIVVPCTRLSSYLFKDSYSFVKLDIEGAETRVIEECALAKAIPRVREWSVSYHPSPLNPENQIEKIKSCFLSAGFRQDSFHQTRKGSPDCGIYRFILDQ